MELKEAIKILKYYNEWKRGEKDKAKYSPVKIGEAIDVIIGYLEGLG